MSDIFKKINVNTAIEYKIAVKKLHYTVSPIADIKAWREERERFEQEWHESYMKRVAAAKAEAQGIVEAQDRVLALSEIEKREVEYVKSREEKTKNPSQINYNTAKCHDEPADWKAWRLEHEDEYKPKRLSLWQRVKAAWCQLWHNAFPQ